MGIRVNLAVGQVAAIANGLVRAGGCATGVSTSVNCFTLVIGTTSHMMGTSARTPTSPAVRRVCGEKLLTLAAISLCCAVQRRKLMLAVVCICSAHRAQLHHHQHQQSKQLLHQIHLPSCCFALFAGWRYSSSRMPSWKHTPIMSPGFCRRRWLHAPQGSPGVEAWGQPS